MKKLINAVDTILAESLDGFAAAHADILALGEDRKFVRRRTPKPGKVALVSGGGSGHEPLHAGFVGHGMLDAACPGQVFTSPTPDQMLDAAQAVDGGAGILFIVKNYEGDVMNFDMAAEMLSDAGSQVMIVTTNDDVAVEDSLYTTGRRGVAGTLVVEKIVGAAAEAGLDLAALKALGDKRERPHALDGRGADELHCPGRRQADLRDRRRRDGDGRRHPRRARPPPRRAATGRPHRRGDGDRHPRRSRAPLGRSAPLRQRLRRHAGDGALPGLQRRAGACSSGTGSRSPARWSATT